MECKDIIFLTQYFVNKQNLRSFSNIINKKILKDKDSTAFIKHVFGENYSSMTKLLTSKILEILSMLQSNVRKQCKLEFKDYFSDANFLNATNNMTPVKKDYIFNKCWNALFIIVPRNFYSSNHNIKVFRKLVQTVVYSMYHQHIFLTNYLKKWDYSVSPWNDIQDVTMSSKVLLEILKWIIKYILSAIICLNFYVTTCKLNSDEYKLYFFWKSHWQSFYDKKVSAMLHAKIIQKYDPFCIGNTIKRFKSLGKRQRLRNLTKQIPKLYLILKNENGYRPIVRYKKCSENLIEKCKFKERLHFLKVITKLKCAKIEVMYRELYYQWLHLNKPKLFFVKSDLSNAFGSINKERLLKIMAERHMAFQKMEKDSSLKRKFAQHYRDMVTELRKPLLVRSGSTVYEWKEGLVQGYKYSPALSELYYSYMDEKYFSAHLNKSESKLTLFTRVVDDYLYITNSLEDAYLFLDALSSYRNVNYSKTVVSFEHPLIKLSEDITFLGLNYNTSTLQVGRAKNVFVGPMCYRIAFTSSIKHLYRFIENRIGQSGVQISAHIFNLYYNSEEIIWKHIFTTFCLSANKFCTILAILCEDSEMRQYLSVFKKKVTVKLGNAMVSMLAKNKPKDTKFIFCINHLRYLSFKALHLCAKNTPKCNKLMPFIKDELVKTDCVYGKWKDHSSLIDTNGERCRTANKEVCRRKDLRIIFKQFDALPNGFQCFDFDHNNLKT